MTEDEVFATLIRSPLDQRTWVPFLPGTEVMDSVYAGPLRKVKDAARERVETALRGWYDDLVLVWRRDDDDWILVPKVPR